MNTLDPRRQPWETVDYTDNPDLPELDDLVELPRDFLPKPDDLIFRKPVKKVTLVLDQESIDFFKAEAQRLNVPSQRMIRALLQHYVARAKQ